MAATRGRAALTQAVLDRFSASRRAQDRFLEENAAAVARAVEVLVRALRAGRKALLCGNGGSAADAQHFAAELVGRFYLDRAPLPAIALTTDTSLLTAVANDFGYDVVFSKQVEALGRKGDVLVAISTSGNSPNVLRAAEAARGRGLVVIALTGGSGGKLAPLADVLLNVPGRETTPRVQEAHLVAEHVICELVEAALFGADANRKGRARRGR